MKNVIDSILASAACPEQWTTVLDELNTALDVTASAMFSVHEFEALRTNFSWSSFWEKNCNTEEVQQFLRDNDQDDQVAYENLFRMKPQCLYAEMEAFRVGTRAELPPSKIRDFTDSLGIIDRIAGQLNSIGPWLDGVFFHPTTSAQAKKLRENPKVDIILPLMAGSLSLGRQLAALRAQYQVSLSVLDALGVGVFLIDVSGCVIERNSEAQRILDQQDGIVLKSSAHLSLGSADMTARFDRAVKTINGLLRGDIAQPDTVFSVARP